MKIKNLLISVLLAVGLVGPALADYNPAAPYSFQGNNTASTISPPLSLQQIVLGTPGYTDTGYNLAQITVASGTQGNTYAQFSIQGLNAGTAASTDFVATADNGTMTSHYVNMGINSSGNLSGTYPTGANIAYLETSVSADPLYVGTVGSATLHLFAASTDYLDITSTNANIVGTTSASSSTTGALTIGNGTAGTNVGIGAGNVNAGATITAPTFVATTLENVVGTTLTLDSLTHTTAMTGTTISGSYTGSATAQIGVALTPTINQASTSSFTALNVNTTNSAFGTGAQYLLNLQGAGNSVLNVGNLTYGALVTDTGFGMNMPAETYTATGTSTVASMGLIHIGQPTLTNAGAGTVTALATLLIDNAPAVAGSQVGTNKYALDVLAGTSIFNGTATFAGGITASGATANDFSAGSGAFKTSTGAVTIGTGAVAITGALTITGPTATTALTLTNTARTSGVLPYIKYTIPTDTGQTAATESPGIQGVTGTRTWATTGTIALQREIFWPGPTYASASASQTFTDVFNTYWTPPVAGSNAIFTREHTLGVVDSTSSTTAITGGVIVATTLGTPATSVGIGGGNITAGGNIFASTSTGRIGYLVGSGVGTAVTQLTSRTTAVSSNTPTGAITLFAAAGSATPATFTVDCTSIAVGDTVIISEASGTDQYIATCSAISAGVSFNITFYSEIGTTSDSPVLNYTIIKGSSN